jgi:hypothetical protein
MGADTRIYVKVLKTREEWIEVYAPTLLEAETIAAREHIVLGSQYEEPPDDREP